MQGEQYGSTLIENNICGRVLFNCNLEELKKLCGMSFGDWELFRLAILTLRERELNPRPATSPNPQPLISQSSAAISSNYLDVDCEVGRMSRSNSLRGSAFTTAAAGDGLKSFIST